MENKIQDRLIHLDSLRGIAAVTVALHHSILCINGISHQGHQLGALLGSSPVIFFFLLSGFVLSKSLLKNDGLSLTSIVRYYIRRIFRLYPAVLIAIFISALLAKYYANCTDYTIAGDWLKKSINNAQQVGGFKSYINELILINTNLDNPLWTIKVEFVCSFIFPFLLLIVNKNKNLKTPFFCILSVALYYSSSLGNYYWEYIFIFYLGYLVFESSKFLKTIPSSATLCLLSIGFMLLLFTILSGFMYVTAAIILAGILSVLVPCNSKYIKNLLLSRPIEYLGRISFSFYLLNVPFTLLVFSLCKKYYPSVLVNNHPIISALMIFVSSFILTIVAASLSFFIVEDKFNKIGHSFSKQMSL